LVLGNPLASRRHVRLYVNDVRVVAEDLGSQNGVFLNGARLKERTVLKHQDVLRFGSDEVVLLEGGDARFPSESPTDLLRTPNEEPTLIPDYRLALLSPREREVLTFVVHGFTHREIAERLCISIKTVESHKNRIGNKLELKSRAELVRFALDHGLLRSSWSEPP